MMLSDVCLSVAYIGPKSRTERPRKTKIGTEVAHVTRDSDGHHFQGQKVKVTRPLYSPPCWRVRQLQRWVWERVGRVKLLLRCRLLGRARCFGANGGRRGSGAYRGGRPPTACLIENVKIDKNCSYLVCWWQRRLVWMLACTVRLDVQSPTVIAPRCTVRRPWQPAFTTLLEYSTDRSSPAAAAAARTPAARRRAVRPRAATAPATPTATS